jgi:hypothetical protein
MAILKGVFGSAQKEGGHLVSPLLCCYSTDLNTVFTKENTVLIKENTELSSYF